MNPAAAGGAALLPARLRNFFAAALVALTLLWLPLSVIPIVDGLLFVANPMDVLRDLALLWWMALVPAAVLAAAAQLLHALATRTGLAAERAGLLAWSLLLLPLTWVIVWQAARMGWQWTRTIVGADLAVSQEGRVLATLALLGLLALLLRRGRLQRAVRRFAQALVAAAPAAALLLALGLLVVLFNPPALLRGAADVPRQAKAPAAPDIILITLDAVAAADADVCNPASTVMPRLARLAAGANCFPRFYAASNLTTATTSTLETGLLPWTHFATQPDATMAPATRKHTLAAQLQAQGWRTHMLTDNLLASPRHRGSWRGYSSAGLVTTTLHGNGFREVMTLLPDTALSRLVATSINFLGAFDIALHGEHSPYQSERTYADLQTLLQAEPGVTGGGAPLFVWAHTLPPHSPYLPPPSTKYRLLPKGELETWRDMLRDNIAYPPASQPLVDKHRLRYRESLMAADAALGQFLDELQRQGRLDRALLVISSDHGESFEHGFLGHAGPLIHDTLIRVPLVVKMPGQVQGRTIDTPVSQADIAPTLLDLGGAPPLPHAQGRSLRVALEGGVLTPAPVFAMTMERQNRFRPLAQGHFVVIDGPLKLRLNIDPAATRPATLFDLVADPGEQRDLAAEQANEVARLSALLRARIATAEAARQAALR